MADLDNTQTTPAGLPEKKWFTLEEIAARWRCSVGDVLHYGESDRLRICSKFPAIAVTDDEWFYEHSTIVEKREPLGLMREDLMKVLKGETITPRFVYTASIQPDDPFCGFIVVPHEDVPMPTVDKASLVIVTAERDRFEKENRIGAYAGTMPDLNELMATGYTTPHMDIMRAAIAEFFDPRQVTDAKKEEVVAWIKTKMTEAELPDSNNIASALFTIIKPTDHDPKKRRGSTPQSPL